MRAAVIEGAGKTPVVDEFRLPVQSEDMEVVQVRASALSPFSKSRSSGSHYSAENLFPSVAGADGVGLTLDGRRVYFALPEAPFGGLAEQCLVRKEHCIAVPDSLDDVTAAAIANPGMSAWAALMERAHLQPGETVLINGATGSAGQLAVQIAKYLGAARVIAAGRNEEELEALRSLGADETICFKPGLLHPGGSDKYEDALKQVFSNGVDVVLDYLWGESAKTVIVAIARAVEDAKPVRFVHVGGASGEEKIDLPGAALRSSAIQMMGSGAKSVPLPKLLGCIEQVFKAAETSKFQIATKVMPFSAIEEAWSAPGKPRIVITLP